MNFFEWYGTGIIIILVLFSWQAYVLHDTLKKAANELYDVFIRKANMLSTVCLLVVALLGPLLIPIIAYLKFRDWQDGLAVDEDDNKDYPWSKE